MKSLYLLFVKQLAGLVGGRYPAHYDSRIKTQVRILWIVGIPLCVGVSWMYPDIATESVANIESWSSSPAYIGVLLLIVSLTIVTWRTASLRRTSIEKYILETNKHRLVNEDSSETVQDAVFLSDYLLTYIALLFITHSYIILPLFVSGSNPWVMHLRYLLFVPSLYYALIVIDMLIPLLFRWGRQYVQNDKNTTTNPNQTES